MEAFTFTATEGSVDSQDDSLSVSLGSGAPDCYLAIQRFTDDARHIYIVLNDQANGAFNKIASVRCSPQRLDIRLTEPIDRQRRYSRIHVTLQISATQFAAIAETLAAIFLDSAVDFAEE